MKDIKTLYNEAKKSRKESDIAAYKEAIQMYLESNPYGYISNLEYIITSDIGANTLKKFVETNGLPIACYETVQEVLENAIHKCDVTDKDSSVFKEASEWLSNYKKKYLNCFMMYEYYTDEVDPRYVESYYGFNDSGIQGRKLAAGMIGKFGESSIADALITSDFIGAKATVTLHDYCTNRYQNDAMIYEWLSVTSKDLLIHNYAESVLSHINNSSLSSKVNNSKLERQKVLREAVIIGNDNVAYEYSDNEIDDIKNLISFKEYMLTWADEFSESKITDIQKDIYSLYEELGYAGEFDESDADLVEMLPGSPVEEGAPWLVNTRDKKTGTSPTYINRNHDMANYGEDNGPSEEIVKSDKPDMSMDDYKRPSAGGSSINIDQDDDDDSKDGSADTSPNENPTGVQNYYYYTYNNSLNKNNHSFNKDNSTKDDHSVRNTGNTYDSSTGKHVNSHNNNVEGVKENPEDDDFEDVKESFLPWELDIGVENNTFTESFFSNKKVASCRIKKLPKSLADIIRKANKYIRDEMEDIAEYDDEKRMTTKDRENLSDYLSKMKEKIFFNEIGYTLIKIKKDKYHGEIIVIPDLSGRVKHDDIAQITKSQINSDGTISYSTENERRSVEESEDFIKQYNNIMKISFDKYKEESNPDCDDYKIKLVGNDSPKTFKYIILSLSEAYAEKLFNHIKHPKDYPMSEAVGDADDMKPESDHPVKDILTDIDRATVKKQQQAKKKIQDVQNVGRAAMKPVNRTKEWVGSMIGRWKDADETNIKEKMADPHARRNLFTAIKKSVTAGSLLKAGLLLNPVFLFLTVTRGVGKNKREFRIRNEMIGEIKTEISIIDEKIKDADSKGDNKAKYQLMRFKNELNKKLLRVGGGKRWAKLV